MERPTRRRERRERFMLPYEGGRRRGAVLLAFKRVGGVVRTPSYYDRILVCVEHSQTLLTLPTLNLPRLNVERLQY